ncbi:MAG: hypothetical protein R3F61_04190 [Myxococcota bacterium]
MTPTYQALWTCRVCDSKDLLELTHAFCPSCGHARDTERAVFPHWDGLVASDSHPLHGGPTRCCGVGWAPEAHNCGCCGQVLARPTSGSTERVRGSLADFIAAAMRHRDDQQPVLQGPQTRVSNVKVA